MDVATQAAETTVARYDNLAGICRIEVGCWNGEVRVIPWDDAVVPGLLVTAPMRSAVDFWNIAMYKQGTLIVAPDLCAAAYTDFHNSIKPASPMLVYLGTPYANIPVVNTNNM